MNTEHCYVYFDEQDVMSYFVGTRQEFKRFIKDNQDYSTSYKF